MSALSDKEKEENPLTNDEAEPEEADRTTEEQAEAKEDSKKSEVQNGTEAENEKEEKKSKSKRKKSGDIHVPKSKKLKLDAVAVRDASVSEAGVVYYDIHVRTKQHSWVVQKRYSEFEELHNILSSRFPRLPFLPAKHYKLFTNHTDSAFIEQRRALLDNYVKKLTGTKDLQSSQEVVNFFHNGVRNDMGAEHSDTQNEESKSENSKANDKTESNGTESKKEVKKESDSYEYPEEQEVTGITITNTRKMSDHVLYQFQVENARKRSSYSSWTVHRRFTQFWEMDQNLRSALTPEIVEQLPLPPPRKMKYIYNHKDDQFIEERRVLLQNYLRKALRIPQVANNQIFLEFLGVEV